jgi:hypothetical protein
VLARGIGVRYSSDQAATARFQLLVSARDARAVGLAGGGAGAVSIGRVSRLVGAGRAGGRIRLARWARERLAALGARRPVRLEVKLTLIGASGAARTYTARATLRP